MRPEWLPEGARIASSFETHENLVSYLAPDGSVRRYICSDKEARFYHSLFQGLVE